MYFASSRQQTEDPTRTAKIYGLPKSISQENESTNTCKAQSNAAHIVVTFDLHKVPENATLMYIGE